MSQEAKWYVVHTYSGYENKVKEDLEKSVENLDLQDTILEVKYPTEEAIEILPNGMMIDKITTYDEYLESDEMARKRTTYTAQNTDDEEPTEEE